MRVDYIGPGFGTGCAGSLDKGMRGRKMPVIPQGYDLNSLRDKGQERLQQAQWGFLVKRNGVEMREPCGPLSLRCIFDVQMEISKKQLDILGCHSRQRLEPHK